ncbi:hypothetical protein GE061_012013 [Apolygus lucorum]|uniref:LIM zinc-binding domain-containing protein n=1 Tax=Apolygus lucorum TaxID=248454 RepID=A0A8S9XT66_APOLU|nr:hypothetical protein GE061_012013 [Apolygus lucorum]
MTLDSLGGTVELDMLPDILSAISTSRRREELGKHWPPRSAQEQLKKVEEIKKAKKVQKDDVEDWQSNLDNWKCSRRKRIEETIERVVEVKKFELEEHERNRRKSKTFSEMMQDRNSKGRKTSLPVYHNDEDDDLSELGLSSHKTGSSDTASNADQASSIDGETTLKDEAISKVGKSLDTSTKESKDKQNSPKPPTSNESQEYTYEWAIQNYVNFAENRVKSKSTTNILDEPKKNREYPPIATKPVSTAKADNYLKSIDKNRSSPEEVKKSPVAAVPKVDISGRRQLFEKMKNSDESQKSPRTSPDVPGKKIKERLSSLEEQKKLSENILKENKLNGFSSEASVKNRLMNIESISSQTTTVKKVVEPITSISIKDRLNSLSKPDLSSSTNKAVVENSVSIKDRLNSLQSSIVKEPVKTNIEINSTSVNEKAAVFKESCDQKFEKDDKVDYEERAYSPDDIGKRQQHFRHRSLDSLDIDHENVQSGSFERVQSLEDLDYCRNYPPSTFSGDTDREDSGIHTADVSSSVSQADDYDLHLDSTVILNTHQPPIVEESRLSERYGFADPRSPPPVSPTLVEEPSSKLLHFESLSNCLPSIPEVSNVPEIHTTVHTPPLSSCPSFNENLDVSCVSFNHPNANSTMVNQTISDEPTLSPEPIESMVCPSHLHGVHIEEHCREFINHEQKCDPGVLPGASVMSHVLVDSSNSSKDLQPPKELTPPPTATDFTVMSVTQVDVLPKENMSTEPGQFKGIVMDMYSETPQDCLFNLNPVGLEPPKEKPPPPPTDLSDEEVPEPKPHVSLRRLDSTKRIKKEIRQKRSSFLGIEGNDDDSYLEPEMELVRPPDMTALLAEERRIERQMYRQSICSESDSNQESRDSGVELDPKIPETWSHSRNDSEVYGNQSTTSEEDEIMKKEREIIETLEEEEKIRKQDMENKLKLGETLAMKLRELEAKKERYEWENTNGLITEDYHVEQHNVQPPRPDPPQPDRAEQIYRLEPVSCRQELVQRRPIETYQNVLISPAMHVQEMKRPVPPPQQDWPMMAQEVKSREALDASQMRDVIHRKSLQDLRRADQMKALHRRSMPDLQEAQPPIQPRRPPPPPPTQQLPLSVSIQPQNSGPCSQQMTRQTLQALSAAPRSRLISNDTWQAQAKRKQPRPDNCNYQHWLIQEAEHRRITEQHQRQMGAIQQQRPVPMQQLHPSANNAKWQQQQQQLQQQQNSQYYPENNWNQVPAHHPAYPTQPQPPPQPQQRTAPQPKGKPLPDAIIQTLTQRVQRMNDNNNNNRRRHEANNMDYYNHTPSKLDGAKDKMLSVSGKKRCSHCGDELGRGAAMIIESLQLFYHIECFKCCVCCLQLGDGLMGTDVRVRNNKLHCHNCYSSDDGAKFSCV